MSPTTLLCPPPSPHPEGLLQAVVCVTVTHTYTHTHPIFGNVCDWCPVTSPLSPPHRSMCTRNGAPEAARVQETPQSLLCGRWVLAESVQSTRVASSESLIAHYVHPFMLTGRRVLRDWVYFMFKSIPIFGNSSYPAFLLFQLFFE